MGNNCTCLTPKDSITDLNIVQKKRTRIFCKLLPSKNIIL